MFGNKKAAIKDVPGWRFEKKRVPFTVVDMKAKTPIEARQELDAWRAKIEVRSIIKRHETREKAINAYSNYFGTDRTVKAIRFELKKSIFTRIYDSILNFFLNINY